MLNRRVLRSEGQPQPEYEDRQHRSPHAFALNTRRWCDSGCLPVGGSAREIRGNFGGSIVTVRFGAFTLNSDQRQLTREGEDVHLTPKAFDLLGLLVAEAPRVVR